MKKFVFLLSLFALTMFTPSYSTDSQPPGSGQDYEQVIEESVNMEVAVIVPVDFSFQDSPAESPITETFESTNSPAEITPAIKIHNGIKSKQPNPRYYHLKQYRH